MMSASSGGVDDLPFIANFDDCGCTVVRCGPYSCRSVRRRRWRRLWWGIQWRCKRFWREWQRSHEQAPSAGTGGPTRTPSGTATGGAGSPQQPTGEMNLNSAMGGAVTPSIVPPGATGSGGNPVSSSSGVPGKAQGLPVPLATRLVLAISDRKPRRSSALRSRVTRRPRAFATDADPRCSLTEKLGRWTVAMPLPNRRQGG